MVRPIFLVEMSFPFLSVFNPAHALTMTILLFLQELRMYNPEYLDRPYVVILNKIDLPEVCGIGASMWVTCYLLISFYFEKGGTVHPPLGDCVIW